ncbi:MAG: thioredoxin [Elusimicrobia bacterium]|nr:thioredoxin [Elusimicrobiota bacterium]
MSGKQLTDANFNAEVIKSDVPVMVDFWAPWCGPCKMLGPVIEELAKEYDGKIKICKLNTDESPVSASNYKITAIPTLMFFKGGKVIAQSVGMQSKNEIKRKLDGLL